MRVLVMGVLCLRGFNVGILGFFVGCLSEIWCVVFAKCLDFWCLRAIACVCVCGVGTGR